MTFLIHLFVIYEMRSSLSVTGSILPLLLSVMAIRYSPNNSMNREPSSRPFTAPRIRNQKHLAIDNKGRSFSEPSMPWPWLRLWVWWMSGNYSCSGCLKLKAMNGRRLRSRPLYEKDMRERG